MSLKPPLNNSGTASSSESSSAKVIYIVGSGRLQNEALASCLQQETGDRCLVLETLGRVPLNQASDDSRQGLVLLDCQGKDEKNA